MTIIFGLGLAALLAMGWYAGSVFVALFLTFGELWMMTFLGLLKTGDPTLLAIAVGVLLVIWAPIYLRGAHL